MINERAIMTFSGRMFDFWNPLPESLCIEDIAHHLALINRFTGATSVPYSVAEHCVRMSYMVEFGWRVDEELSGDPLSNLLHDAAEAYIGDTASPQKKYLLFELETGPARPFAIQEFDILRTIYCALKLVWPYTPENSATIKIADKIMLRTEIRDLMPANAMDQPEFSVYLKGVEPLWGTIYPWNWQTAERNFLQRFEELTRNG